MIDVGRRIGVGMVGSGFIGHVHVRSWQGVRDADIVAVSAAHDSSAQKLARVCRELGVGEPAVFTDVRELARHPDVEAVWITVPNNVRVPVVEAIVEEVKAGRVWPRGGLRQGAC